MESELGWSNQMLKSINTISPNFYIPSYLSDHILKQLKKDRDRATNFHQNMQ